MRQRRGPSRGIGILLALLVATAVLAYKLPEPFRALSIGLGVAAIAAEFSVIGYRVADGILWLASQPFPRGASRRYLALWRGDLRDDVDGQGPLSFSLDVLASIPSSAMREWKALPKYPLTTREKTVLSRLNSAVLLSALAGTFVPFLLPSSVATSMAATILFLGSSLGLALVVGRIISGQNVLLVTATLFLFYGAGCGQSAVAYALWATAGLLLAAALNLRILRHRHGLAVIAYLTLPPVFSVAGGANWVDYVGQKWSYVLFLACAAPFIAVATRIVTRAIKRSKRFTLPAVIVWSFSIISILVQAGPRLSTLWIVSLLTFLAATTIGLMIEMRNPLILAKPEPS